MGSWRRVKIEGTCDGSEVESLRQHLAAKWADDHWGPLHNGGITGLPNWAATTIDAVGTLAKPNFDEHDVADALEACAEVAPSLDVQVHVGAPEGDECVATVRLSGGEARIEMPQREAIPRPSQEQLLGAFLSQIKGL